MHSEIDFSVSMWMVEYYHFIGTVSLILNFYVLFLVLFKSEKLENFKYFLLAFQSSCLLVDVHMTFLMQPQPLFPIPGGFCTGYLALNDWIPCAHLMTVLDCLMSLQFQTLVLCFFQKLSSIECIENRRVAFWKRCLVYISIPLAFAAAAILFVLLGNSREKSFEIIERLYPEYEEQFQGLTNFVLYELNVYWFTLLVEIVVVVVWFGSVTFYCTKRINAILGRFKSRMSAVSHKRHKSAMRSLVAQLITSGVGFLPPTLLCSLLIIESQYSQKVSRFLILLYSTHATLNALVLLATTPHYREFTFFWMKRRRITPKILISNGASAGIKTGPAQFASSS